MRQLLKALKTDPRQFVLDLFGEPSSAALPTPAAKPVSAPDLEQNQPIAGVNIAQAAINTIANQVQQPAVDLQSITPPTRFAHPRATRELHLQNCTVAFELRRAKRRTIGFVVGDDGLTISAPKWVPLYEIDKACQEKAVWIVKKLGEAQERREKMQSQRIVWQEGASIPFLGESVILVLDPRHAFEGGAQLQTDAAALPGVPRLTLHIGLSQSAEPERIRDAVQAWLMRQAKRVFEERLNHYAPQLGVQWRKCSLSSAGTRWGSAGSDGSIRLNWRLIHFRQSVIDYVIVHELSHLRVMDHSPRFWNTVESVLPDYHERKSQLKDEALPVWH
jgi:predicted metal-dependent hydrolase